MAHMYCSLGWKQALFLAWQACHSERREARRIPLLEQDEILRRFAPQNEGVSERVSVLK